MEDAKGDKIELEKLNDGSDDEKQAESKDPERVGHKAITKIRQLKPNKILRFLRYGIVLILTIGLCVTVINQVIRYASTPASTTIRQHDQGFIWPDVTVCNSFLFNMTNVSDKEFNQYNASFEEYKEIFMDLIKNNSEDVNAFSVIQANNKFKNLTKQSSEMIISCFFKNKECSFTNFTLHRHPTLFNCFTFKPTTRLSKLPGPKNGLKLILFAGSSSAHSNRGVKSFEKFNGFTVSIHSPNTLPDFQNNVIEVPTGREVNINLKALQSVQLKSSTNKCTDKKNATTIDFPGYRTSEIDCIEQALQEAVMAKCDCEDPELYRRQLSAKKTSCLKISTEAIALKKNLTEDYLSILKKKVLEPWLKMFRCYMSIEKNDLLLNLTCSSDCEEVSYQLNVNSHSWPQFVDQISKDIDDKFQSMVYNDEYTKKKGDIQYLRRRFAFLRIYPGKVHTTRVTEVRSYTFFDLISDFGANMGLWLSLTFLSIYDLLVSVLSNITRRAAVLRNKRK